MAVVRRYGAAGSFMAGMGLLVGALFLPWMRLSGTYFHYTITAHAHLGAKLVAVFGAVVGIEPISARLLKRPSLWLVTTVGLLASAICLVVTVSCCTTRFCGGGAGRRRWVGPSEPSPA